MNKTEPSNEKPSKTRIVMRALLRLIVFGFIVYLLLYR